MLDRTPVFTVDPSLATILFGLTPDRFEEIHEAFEQAKAEIVQFSIDNPDAVVILSKINELVFVALRTSMSQPKYTLIDVLEFWTPPDQPPAANNTVSDLIFCDAYFENMNPRLSINQRHYFNILNNIKENISIEFEKEIELSFNVDEYIEKEKSRQLNHLRNLKGRLDMTANFSVLYLPDKTANTGPGLVQLSMPRRTARCVLAQSLTEVGTTPTKNPAR